MNSSDSNRLNMLETYAREIGFKNSRLEIMLTDFMRNIQAGNEIPIAGYNPSEITDSPTSGRGQSADSVGGIPGLSLGNHTHQYGFADVTPTPITGTGATGTGLFPARDDHVHELTQSTIETLINGAAITPKTISGVASISMAGIFTSTWALSAPFVVASTTVCTNLNADLWDGYHFASYLNQAVKTTSSPTFVGLTLSGAVSGITTIGMSGQLTNTLAIGTAPFAVTSTTVCGNLNADLWDGYHFADYINQAVKTTSGPSFASLTVNGTLLIPTSGGVDISSGVDEDHDLITLTLVTGTPRLWWDESEDSFSSTHGLQLMGASGPYMKFGSEQALAGWAYTLANYVHIKDSSGNDRYIPIYSRAAA